jgi:hypothetical protein
MCAATLEYNKFIHKYYSFKRHNKKQINRAISLPKNKVDKNFESFGIHTSIQVGS